MDRTLSPHPVDQKARLDWLDAFRGLTIAAMILVNNPGTWSRIYPPLRHAKWDGCTPTDLVFPFFLFIAGFAMSLSMRRSGPDKPRITLQGRLARRALLLVLVGLFLSGFPHFDLERLRYPGVLQRIGLCVLVVGSLEIWLSRALSLLFMLGMLVAYHGALFGLSFPSGDFRSFTEARNPIGAFDLRVLGANHLWVRGVFDPEGLISTLTAAWNVFLGLLCGRCFQNIETKRSGRALFFAAGPALALLGIAVASVHQPWNKALWTPSFAIFTSGLAWILIVLWRWIWAAVAVRPLFYPLVAFGRNPLLLFVLSGLLARTLGLIRVTSETGVLISQKEWIFRHWFATWLSPLPASLGYALATVTIFFLLAWWLDRRRIYVKL